MTGVPSTRTDRALLRPSGESDTESVHDCGATGVGEDTSLRIDCVWRLDLAHALQTTLNPRHALEIFARHGAAIVAHDAVAFVASKPALRVTCGRPGLCRHHVDLRLAGRCLGRLTFSRRHPFGRREIASLEAMSSDLARPLDNALRHREAQEAATRDPLTGAANRNLLGRMLEQEVSLVRRHGGVLALLMVDVDHFKQVNDCFGHTTGDRSLVSVANCIAGCVRSSDTLFRYGGEEFCMLLPRTGARGAWRLAERVREAVRVLRIPAGSETIRLTASVGVASLAPGDDAADLLRKADAALYRAKRNGRNRVSALAPEPRRVRTSPTGIRQSPT